MLPSLDEYLHAQNLRYQWIPSRYIVDHRLLQSDKTGDTPGHTQPKAVVLDATFFRRLSPGTKSKISIGIFQ